MEDLIEDLPDSLLAREVVVGLHWTAVVAARDDALQCGLSSTAVGVHAHGEKYDVAEPGRLGGQMVRGLARLVDSSSPTERSVGLAGINAGLAFKHMEGAEVNAGELLGQIGAGLRVALVGHFPFIPELREAVGELLVIERDPGPGELPASAAPKVLPTCAVVALTALTLVNGTFGELMASISPNAYTALIGPSAPLSPVLFEHGLNMIAGTYVERIEPVVQAVKQGANYRQIHRIGTRFVTLTSND